MKFNKKQVLFTVFAIFLSITFLEVTLNLLVLASPKVNNLLSPPWISIPHSVPDDRLGHRLNPKYPGHDSKGFRNKKVPSKADIITLGDSQTYGTGVQSQDAWPRQLESMTAKTVYNMAAGGYGPVHSLILWGEAVALEPKIIIEAFYAGNDLFDSFDLVYNRGQLPELRSSDVLLQESIRQLEQSEPIAERDSVMFLMGATNNNARKEPAIATRKTFTSRNFLSQYSKVYGLFRRIQYEVTRPNRPKKSP